MTPFPTFSATGPFGTHTLRTPNLPFGIVSKDLAQALWLRRAMAIMAIYSFIYIVYQNYQLHPQPPCRRSKYAQSLVNCHCHATLIFVEVTSKTSKFSTYLPFLLVLPLSRRILHPFANINTHLHLNEHRPGPIHLQRAADGVARDRHRPKQAFLLQLLHKKVRVANHRNGARARAEIGLQ